jgi:hypothetical protein
MDLLTLSTSQCCEDAIRLDPAIHDICTLYHKYQNDVMPVRNCLLDTCFQIVSLKLYITHVHISLPRQKNRLILPLLSVAILTVQCGIVSGSRVGPSVRLVV